MYPVSDFTQPILDRLPPYLQDSDIIRRTYEAQARETQRTKLFQEAMANAYFPQKAGDVPEGWDDVWRWNTQPADSDWVNVGLVSLDEITLGDGGTPAPTSEMIEEGIETGFHAIGNDIPDTGRYTKSVRRGREYTFEIWIWVETASTASVRVALTTPLIQSDPVLEGAWQKFSLSFVATADGTRNFGSYQSSAGAADWYFAGAKLIERVPPPDFLSIHERMLDLDVAPPEFTAGERKARILAYRLKSLIAGSGLASEEAASIILGATWEYEEFHPDIPGSPDPNVLRFTIPFADGSVRAAAVETFLREVMPAHVDIIVTYGEGFIIGVSQLGEQTL